MESRKGELKRLENADGPKKLWGFESLTLRTQGVGMKTFLAIIIAFLAIIIAIALILPSSAQAQPTEQSRVAVVTFVDTTIRLPMQWSVTNRAGQVVASGTRQLSSDPKIFSFGVPTGEYTFRVSGSRGDFCSMNLQKKVLLSGNIYTFRNRCTFW